MVMKYVNWALRRQAAESGVPRCRSHDVEMKLRGVIGTPARFRWQTEEDYTYIYFCPVEGCNETIEIARASTQVPGGTSNPERPVYARPRDR